MILIGWRNLIGKCVEEGTRVGCRNPRHTSGWYGDDIVLVVSKVEESHGKKVVSIDRVEGQQRSLDEVVEVSPTGLVRLAWGKQKLNPPDVLLKTPFKKGDSWTFDSPSSGKIARRKGICTIVGTETIKTPAGSFEAVQVNVDYQIEIDEEWKKRKLIKWYAPNVGLVKMIGDDNDRVIWLLKSFTPGKK